jgi:hypothetical protein
MNAYFRDTGLPGCFTGWQVCPYLPTSDTSVLWKFQIYNVTLLDDGREYLHSNSEKLSWYALSKCLSLHFNAFKIILIAQLTFIIVIIYQFLFFLLTATVRMPPFEKHRCRPPTASVFKMSHENYSLRFWRPGSNPVKTSLISFALRCP